MRSDSLSWIDCEPLCGEDLDNVFDEMPAFSSAPKCGGGGGITTTMDDLNLLEFSFDDITSIGLFQEIERKIEMNEASIQPLMTLQPEVGVKRSWCDDNEETVNNNNNKNDMCRPSSYLRKVLCNKSAAPPPYKRSRTESPVVKMLPERPIVEKNTVVNDILHRACSDNNKDLVKSLLEANIGTAGQPAVVHTTKQVYDIFTNTFVDKLVAESYQYPLNIALKANMDKAIIKMLITAAPEVMTIPDGSSLECSLHVCLKYRPNDLCTVDALLLETPYSTHKIDRHAHTPLHIACAKGSSVDVLRHLCIINPSALCERNFYGLNPLQVAERSIASTDEMCTYLRQKTLEQ